MKTTPASFNHPGQVLLDQFLVPRGESVAKLAGLINEPVARLLEIISGRGSITDQLALKLAQHYGVAATFWLKLQARHDHQAQAA